MNKEKKLIEKIVKEMTTIATRPLSEEITKGDCDIICNYASSLFDSLLRTVTNNKPYRGDFYQVFVTGLMCAMWEHCSKDKELEGLLEASFKESENWYRNTVLTDLGRN
jgi:hypothetical protein